MHYPTKKIKRSTNVTVSNLSRDNILFSTFYTGLFYFLGKKLGGARPPPPPGPSPCYGTVITCPTNKAAWCLCSHVLPRSQANVLDSLKLSLEQASNIEREAKDQSQNPFWHELRKWRLTASKFKQICSRKSDFEGLVSQLKKKTVQTAAMKYGLEHESEAAQYFNIFQQQVCQWISNRICY